MKLRILGLSILLLSLAGCDGRGKILYLQPATAMKPPWSVASVIIPIRGGEDVVGIVTKVASDLGLASDPERKGRWWTRTSHQNTFTLSVGKDEKGYWVVSLMDWPTTGRSEESLKAEAMIRSALKEPIQSPDPTAPGGRGSA